MNHAAPRCIAVVTTLPSVEQAQALARTLVQRRLAACAQIEPIESLYIWDGALQQEPEVRLLLKTVAPLYDRVAEAITALHSYELPAIHAVALDPIAADYARWIAGACSADNDEHGAAAAAPRTSNPTPDERD